jgi:uncharacterized protein (TIGR02246 family)
MTARLVALLVAGSFAFACAGGEQQEDQTPAAAVSADEAAIEQLRADYVTHYNLHHASVVADLFADSAFGLWADGTVTMGKPAVLADLESDMAGSPTLTIDPGEVMVIGDYAVGHGTYGVSVTPPGATAPVSLGGHYMTYFQRTNGTWKIAGVASNFDAAPPEGTMSTDSAGAPPPDEGTMQQLVAAYTQAVAASDWSALANLYAEDAIAAFTQAPALQGRAAILERFNTNMTGVTNPMIEIHDVGTMDLGNGWAIDGGWYVLTSTAPAPAGNMVQSGAYLHLLRQQPDGSWQIHWAVSNGQPKPAT